jgi:hypothetical protein
MVPVTARRLSKYVEKLCGEKSPRGFSYFFRFSVKCWGGKEIRPPLILYVDPFLYTDVSVRVGACHSPKIIEICRKALQREIGNGACHRPKNVEKLCGEESLRSFSFSFLSFD